MVRFVGLDVHKRVIQACILDESGRVAHQERLPCTGPEIERFAGKVLRREDQVALEATTNSWSVVDLIQPHVARVVVSNPLKTKAIAEAKVKTDKVDAKVLAQLLRCDFLPSVWVPDEETRDLRRWTTRRSSLVADRTAIKNRIHAVLAHRLIQPPVAALFSKTGLEWLRTEPFLEADRLVIESDLRVLEGVEREIEETDRLLAQKGYAEDRVKLLMTLPGVDVTVAQTILAALGDISRFPDGDHAASYLGLVPSTKQSAGKCYHGPITKQGRSHARWMLIEAAQHMDRHPGPLGHFFRKKARKNRNVAVVAVARKMVVIAYHMIKNNEPYRYATPESTKAKLARLRIRATGEVRTGGRRPATGVPPVLSAGHTKNVPSLPEVLRSEGLPLPTPLRRLPLGEKRMLAETGTLEHAERIQSRQAVPRSVKTTTATTEATPTSSPVAAPVALRACRGARPPQGSAAPALQAALAPAAAPRRTKVGRQETVPPAGALGCGAAAPSPTKAPERRVRPRSRN